MKEKLTDTNRVQTKKERQVERPKRDIDIDKDKHRSRDRKG